MLGNLGKTQFVWDEAANRWRDIPPRFRWFHRDQQGFALGINDARHWFLSVHRRFRGAPLYFEFHNYPALTPTIFLSVAISHPREHKRWATHVTVWPPEAGFVAWVLRRFPAKRWSK